MTGPRTEPVRLTVRYEPGVADGAPHRGVAAAVEAVDEDLCSVGWFALRADAPVVMELPRHGRYLLRGRTPDGQLLRTQTEVVADARPAAPREVRLRPEGGPVAGTPPPAPPRFSVTSPVRPPGAGLARVRIEQADGWSTETSAPVGTELLEIVPAPAGTPLRWLPRLRAGSEATLLGYLHQGALEAAQAVVDELTRRDGETEPDRVTGDPAPAGGTTGASSGGGTPMEAPPSLRELAVGYLLLRRSAPHADEWIGALARRMPDHPDVAVLAFGLSLARGRAPSRSRTVALAEAVGERPPLVAEGGRLALRQLLWARERFPDSPATGATVDRAVSAVGQRLAAACPVLLSSSLVPPGTARLGPRPPALPRTPFEHLPAGGGWRLRLPVGGEDAVLTRWAPWQEPRSGAAASRGSEPVARRSPTLPEETRRPRDRRSEGPRSTPRSLRPRPRDAAWWRLGQLSLAGVSRAADPEEDSTTTATAPDGRLRGTLEAQSDGTLLVEVEWTGPRQPPGELLRIRVRDDDGDDDGPSEYLLPLVTAANGRVVGTMNVPVSGERVTVELDPEPLAPDGLDDRDLGAVPRSVRAAGGLALRRWKALAAQRSPTDRLRRAIETARSGPEAGPVP
ncbi:hypothetical protein NW249_26810 [Streptomyces sp. OUCMDZ-4982]|uniref:hypothetical protein n=1 Tax=Streptomyces sp. OUCMDZ-4982 TaxID=2973090 RepID=UPI00215C4A0B|nr:hypothetical protein [Streptomyces sp. OUCMDZ-4982]MCR8945724.1 hypothetical protein [Streptomyces sp. OUCMDZ-4982]